MDNAHQDGQGRETSGPKELDRCMDIVFPRLAAVVVRESHTLPIHGLIDLTGHRTPSPHGTIAVGSAPRRKDMDNQSLRIRRASLDTDMETLLGCCGRRRDELRRCGRMESAPVSTAG